MNKAIILLLLALHSLNALSQGLSGSVKGDDGETIPAATIFIKETTTGTTTNEEGTYHINLEKGTYHIVFQSLGYQNQEITVEISNQTIRQDIILKRQPISIKEVRVYSGKEDPAYAIMRKAIAHAPANLRAVEAFQSEVYIKGTLHMKKIPRLIANKMEVNGAKIKSGDLFTLESLNEISFRAPDQYEHKIISTRSTFPKTGSNDDGYIGYINSSFYQPNIGTTISPLSPSAFTHYRFVYEGYFLQQGSEINQIRVTPKRKSQQLFEGHIYIEDKTWQLQSVDLTNEAFFGKIRIRQTFAPVKEQTWLPVNHNFKIEAAIMGVKADASYIGSVKYKSVVLDKTRMAALQAEEKPVATTSPREKTVKEQKSEETRKNLEEILAKPELNNRDMAKAVRLMEKQERLNDTLPQSLEIKDNYRFVKQTDSIKRTNEDWDLLRPVPLTPEEVGSFQKKDSLKLKAMTSPTDTVKTKQKNHHLTDLIMGGRRYHAFDSTLSIHYHGLVNPAHLSFHPVTGFDYQQKVNASLKLDTIRSINFTGTAGYAFAQEKMNWNIQTGYLTGKAKRYSLWISAGHFNTDLKGMQGVNPQLNSLYNLLLKDNYKVLMRTHQFAITQNMELAHGLNMTVSAQYNYFIEQDNRTDYSFFRQERQYKPNKPINPNATESHLSNSSQAFINTSLRYTPFLKYRQYKGRRIPMGSDYPTFTLRYQQGIPSLWESRSGFTHLQLQATQKREWAVFHNLQWTAEFGKFFNASDLHFSRWQHFSGSDLPIGTDDWETAFSTTTPYMLSTNQWYLRMSGGYASPCLALKFLPFFSNRLWLENIYLHHITLPQNQHYTEVGYGISQIFLFARLGVFAGFNNGTFNEVVFRAGFNF
ncbi:MAG: DUF5686 family protein [Breznakibacter sp.]